MYFPIGDIHGCYDLVRRLYDKIIVRIEAGIDPVYGGTIVFLGDYIDHGPDAPKVLDFIMGLKDDDTGEYPIKHIMLRGNHEEMMINTRVCPDDMGGLKMWLYNGGKETIDQFGVTVQEIIDGALDNYIIWMQNLPMHVQDVDYFFVHAGVNTYKPLDEQNDELACLWDINRDLRPYCKLNKIIIHGHTWQNKNPKPFVDLPNNRIWMDVGANLFGMLCTVCLPEPYDYGYETEGPYEVIKVKTF